MYLQSFRIVWKAVLIYHCCGDVAAWTLAQVNIIWANILFVSQPRSLRPLIYLKVRTHCRNFSTLIMYSLGYMSVSLCVWIGALGSVKRHFTSIQIWQNSNMDAFEKYFIMIFYCLKLASESLHWCLCFYSPLNVHRKSTHHISS